MRPAQAALDQATHDCRSLAAELRKRSSRLVRSEVERQLVRDTVRRWFERLRPTVASQISQNHLSKVDAQYQWLMNAAAKSTQRSDFRNRLRSLPRDLAGIESRFAVELAAPTRESSPAPAAPDFSTLITSNGMQAILSQRWYECEVCVVNGAPLAATIMIGGMLEALFLARIIGQDKPSRDETFKCKAAPKDDTGKPKDFGEWKLIDFILVAHERQWITSTVKDLSNILRDYRNLVHPQKQLSESRFLNTQDATLIWAIARQMITQILSPSPD